MISWIGLVVIAQFINAAIILVDKYILMSARGVGRPLVYAFYVSLLSAVVLVMVPFGKVGWPSAPVAWLSLLTAVSYFFSIYFLYSALKLMDASDAAPVTGAVSALSTFALAYIWLHQDLPQGFSLAIALLIIGTLLLSHYRFNSRSFLCVFVSGLLFGLSAFLVKLIFLQASFADGFFWSRIANVLVALAIILWPGNLKAIRESFHASSHGAKWLLVGNKALSGVSFVLILFAISLGSVSVINALSGLQFVFLLTFAYFSMNLFPQVFSGEIHPHKIHHKLYGIIFIIFGFISLFMQ